MNVFYLNDCLGCVSLSCEELSTGLVQVIKAFKSLSSIIKLRIEKGWVLEKEPDKIQLAGVPLKLIVQNMHDKECRTLFYTFCVNYPIHKRFFRIDVDQLLTANYKFDGADATNMVITSMNGGILLSLPVSTMLMTDYLEAQPNDETYDIVIVPNLHGGTKDNIKAIEKELLSKNYKVLWDLEKIDCLAPNVKISEQFKKRFESLTEENKKSVFERFDEARRNNMLQPLKCNGTIIKHVAPHVSELRIVNPVDIRVYFHEEGDTLYFGKIAYKSEYVGKNDQSNDIADAEKVINGMMAI